MSLTTGSAGETAGETACATKLPQQFAKAVGQAFSLPIRLPRAARGTSDQIGVNGPETSVIAFCITQENLPAVAITFDNRVSGHLR